MRYEIIRYQWPIAKLTFLIVIHRLSLVKAAMNAPCICKRLQIRALYREQIP